MRKWGQIHKFMLVSLDAIYPGIEIFLVKELYCQVLEREKIQ